MRLVTARPAWVVVVTMAITVFLGKIAFTQLGIDTSTEGMVSLTEAYEDSERRYDAAFPPESPELLAVIDAPTPEGARLAAERLVATLKSDPALFARVEWAAGGSFAQQHGLFYLDLPELEELTGKLAGSRAILARLSDQADLPALCEVVGLSAGADPAARPLELDAVFERFTRTFRAAHTGRFDPVSWTELLSGRESGAEGRRQFVLLYPHLPSDQWLGAEPAMRAVRQAAEDIGRSEWLEARVKLTGEVALEYEERRTLERDGIWIAALSLGMVAIVLGFGVRSFRLIGASLITLLVGLVWTAAFAAVVVGDLNMISVAFAALYIGLGIDYAIHLCLRIREVEDVDGDPDHAIEKATVGLGPTLLVCTLSTSIGFFAFIPTAYRGLSQLGLIAGTGMVVSFVVSMTLIPALLRLLPRLRTTRSRSVFSPPWLLTLSAAPQRFSWFFRGLTVVIALGALTVLPAAHFDFNPLKLRDPKSESITTIVEVQSDPRVSFRALNVLLDTPKQEAALTEALRNQPGLGEVRSFADLIPADQEEKIQLLARLAATLGPEPFAGDGKSRVASAEQNRQAMERLSAVIKDTSRSQAGAELARQIDRFLASLAADPAPRREERWKVLHEMLLGTFPAALQQLKSSLEPKLITPDTLPDRLRSQWLGKEGGRRVEIRPEDPVASTQSLAMFVERVLALAPNAVGPPVAERSFSQAITKSFREAIVIALGAIAVLLLIVLRNVADTVRVLATLAMTGVLTAAVTVPLGLAFNYANVIAIPLLLGLGVDTTIHLVRRWREGELTVSALLRTATARAVIVSAFTTMCSFSNLAFAHHRGMASMGQLLFAGTLLMLLVNLLLLPPFLGKRPTSGEA